jgi:hypothetical protein
MSDYFILDDDGEPVPAECLEWAQWFETADRVVLQTVVHRAVASEAPLRRGRPGVGVATVFMGLDHNFYDEGPPILWETMIFGGLLDGGGWRHRSKLEALRGHAAAVARVQTLGKRLPRKTKRAWRALHGYYFWRTTETRLRPPSARRVARLEYRLTKAEVAVHLSA